MAIAVDVADAGRSSGSTVTTDQTIAAGATVFLMGHHWENPEVTLNSVSGGGLTWVVDEDINTAPADHGSTVLARAHAPSGLASGTVITPTWSNTPGALRLLVCSFTGIASSSPLDTAIVLSAGADNDTTVNDGTDGDITITTPGCLILSAVGRTVSNAFTATVGTELSEYDNRVSFVYRIEGSAGTYANEGTIASTGSAWACNTGAYKGAGPTPPTRTGSIATFGSGGAANTGSGSITVPADATLAVAFMSGQNGTTSVFSGGSLTINSVAMTNREPGGDTSTSFEQGACFTLANPATGTQTIAWDFAGSAAMNDGLIGIVVFFKDVDLTGFRDGDAKQQNTIPVTSDTLTAQSSDLIAAWGWSRNPGATKTFTWTGATAVARYPGSGGTFNAAASYAEASPTGNQTVQVTWDQTTDSGGLIALVLKPLTVTSTSSPIIAGARQRMRALLAM